MQFVKITRASGKSNQEVVIGLVKDADPGTLFLYEELRAALAEGTETEYDRAAVQQAVRAANDGLLTEFKRCLRVVANVGYRLAYAREHVELANAHTRRGERQLRRALHRLRNVRTEEMTEPERQRHNDQVVVNEAMYAYMQSQKRQAQRHADLIASLSSRVEQLESRVEGGRAAG